MPVFPSRMVPALSFFLLCSHACRTCLALLSRVAVVTARAQTDQILVIVVAAQLNGHNVVHLNGHGFASFIACLAYVPITFENARTNGQPPAALHSSVTYVAALRFTTLVLTPGHTHAHTLRASNHAPLHAKRVCEVLSTPTRMGQRISQVNGAYETHCPIGRTRLGKGRCSGVGAPRWAVQRHVLKSWGKTWTYSDAPAQVDSARPVLPAIQLSGDTPTLPGKLHPPVACPSPETLNSAARKGRTSLTASPAAPSESAPRPDGSATHPSGTSHARQRCRC